MRHNEYFYLSVNVILLARKDSIRIQTPQLKNWVGETRHLTLTKEEESNDI